MPPVGLAVTAFVVAQIVQPWPEGPILLTQRGLGPHGIVLSDVVLLAVVVMISLAWVRVALQQDGGVSPRRPRSPVVPLVGVVVLAWVGWLGANLLLASKDLRAGINTMESARARGNLADIASGNLLDEFAAAERQFARAHDRLTGPTWAPVRVLPFVGRQMRSLTALSSAATTVAGVGGDGVAEVRRLLAETPPGTAERSTLARKLAEVADLAHRRLASVTLGPRTALVPPLAARRGQLADQLEQLRGGLERGSVGGKAAAELLAGPRRYLLLAANNAEMRAGSGMVLSVGELETSGGVLRLGPMTSAETLLVPEGAVPLDGDLAARWGWLKPNVDWRNLMLSPRFDVSAALAAKMWVALGHDPVDGVIAVDPILLRALLAVTGPVVLDSRTISADTAVEYLVHGQYVEFPEGAQIAERREQLGALAGASLEAVNRTQAPLPALAEGLARAARGRHLLVWSSLPEEQAAWATLGVDGGLQPDSLAVSMLNRGGNKLDTFLAVSSDLSFEPDGDGTRGTLRVVLENRVPPGEPAYIAGPAAGSGVAKDVYLGLFTVTLPGSARNASIEGVAQLAVVGPDGPTRVVGMELAIPPGESRTVVVRFGLPGPQGSVLVEPTARFPATQWSSGSDRWADEGSHRVRW